MGSANDRRQLMDEVAEKRIRHKIPAATPTHVTT